MSFFSPDGALYRFISRFWDMVKLNLMWLLFSVPIVTIGPATVAAFSVTLKMVDETEGYVAHQFVKEFRKNLKNGIPLGLLFLLCIEVVNIDFQLFQKIPGNPWAPLVFGIVAAFIFLMSFIYAFALSARYENTLLQTLKNSASIATRYFVRTLILFIIIAIEIALIFFNLTTMFIGLLIGPACIFLTISGFALPFFREIEKEPNAVTYLPNEADEDYKMPEETPEEMERQRKRRGKK
ncbi:MAG: YesL family protein [Lachnospiraceae bacterium]